MKCKLCGDRLRCVRTDGRGRMNVTRERVCAGCGSEFVTVEQVLTVKRVRVVGMEGRGRGAGASARVS